MINVLKKILFVIAVVIIQFMKDILTFVIFLIITGITAYYIYTDLRPKQIIITKEFRIVLGNKCINARTIDISNTNNNVVLELSNNNHTAGVTINKIAMQELLRDFNPVLKKRTLKITKM